MSAAAVDLNIDQGSTFVLPITYKDPDGNTVDISGYSARMQLRKTVAQADPADLSLVSPTNITVGTTNGQLVVTISATQTGGLTSKKYVYDLEIESPSGVVTRLLQGTVYVSFQVTR